MKEVYKAALYLILCFACALTCSILVWNRPVNPMKGMHLSCVMQLDKDLWHSRGLVSGFNYEMLKQFARDRKCEIEIHKDSYGKDILDSVKCGCVDLAVVNPSIEEDSALVYFAVDSASRWITGRDREWIFHEMDKWLEEKHAEGICDSLKSVYFSSQYNPHKRAAKGLKVNRICPYDEIIKEYADSISWDWKLLASVIWNESHFSINSRSPKGASGLMQIMPRSAAKYNSSNTLDPRENIRTGAMMLSTIEKKLHVIGKDDRLKFVLASYNAGPGNLKSAMDRTAAKGRNKYKWNDVSRTLLEGAEEENSFNGRETVSFVRSVLATHKAICKIYSED